MRGHSRVGIEEFDGVHTQARVESVLDVYVGAGAEAEDAIVFQLSHGGLRVALALDSGTMARLRKCIHKVGHIRAHKSMGAEATDADL